MKIKIKNKPCGLVEFYNAVAREMGYTDTSGLQYDCRKINIAPNIQDGFFNYYAMRLREIDPTVSDNDAKVSTAMTLMLSGPKVDESLGFDEVEIFEGFIC